MKKTVVTILIAIGCFVSVNAMRNSSDSGDSTHSTPPGSPEISRLNESEILEQSSELDQAVVTKNFYALQNLSRETINNAHSATVTPMGTYHHTLLYRTLTKYEATKDKDYLEVAALLITKGANIKSTCSLFVDNRTEQKTHYSGQQLINDLKIQDDFKQHLLERAAIFPELKDKI